MNFDHESYGKLARERVAKTREEQVADDNALKADVLRWFGELPQASKDTIANLTHTHGEGTDFSHAHLARALMSRESGKSEAADAWLAGISVLKRERFLELVTRGENVAMNALGAAAEEWYRWHRAA